MYDFEQAIQLITGINTVKTMKNWANNVERYTSYCFERKYSKNSLGQPYKYKVFSAEEIALFQQVADLRRKNIPLKEAIERVFLTEKEKEDRKKIEVTEQEIRGYTEEYRKLVTISKALLNENKEWKQRVERLEDQMK